MIPARCMKVAVVRGLYMVLSQPKLAQHLSFTAMYEHANAHSWTPCT